MNFFMSAKLLIAGHVAAVTLFVQVARQIFQSCICRDGGDDLPGPKLFC
jgi:hypothetical protein